MNGTTYAPGLVAEAFSFNGVDQYVDLGSDPTLDLGDFTIEAWVFIDPSTNTAERRVVSRDDYTIEGGDGREYFILKSSSSSGCGNSGVPWLELSPAGGGVGGVCGAGPLSAGWHHLAGVRSGPSLTLFVDGEVSGSGSGPTGIISPDAPLIFGNVNPAQLVEPFAGLLDEAAVFNRAVSASEIAAIYAAGNAGKCRSCMAPPSSIASW